MPVFTWKESLPSETSKVGISPPEIRAHKQAIAQWLGTWLEFPGSGNGSEWSAGVFKAGASRALHAAASASSNADIGTLRGKAFLASDTSRLYLYDSSGTYCVGTPDLVEILNDGNANLAYIVQSGQSYVSAPNNPHQNFSFSQNGVTAKRIEFNANPIVLAHTSVDTRLLFGVSTISTGGFTSVASWFASGATSAYTVYWRASGYTSGDGTNLGGPL